MKAWDVARDEIIFVHPGILVPNGSQQLATPRRETISLPPLKPVSQLSPSVPPFPLPRLASRISAVASGARARRRDSEKASATAPTLRRAGCWASRQIPAPGEPCASFALVKISQGSSAGPLADVSQPARPAQQRKTELACWARRIQSWS
jgi:hypothetical protein